MKQVLSLAIAMAIFFVLSTKAQAQVEVTYGPEIGGAFVGMVDDNEVLYAGIDGHLAAVAHVQIGRFFAVRPSVFFKAATMIDAYDNESKMNLNRAGVNLPLLFSYNFERGSKVFVGGGPALIFHLSGKFDEYGDKTNINFGTSAEDDMKPVDLALHLKAGFQFSKGLSLSLFFNNSLGDLRPVNDGYGKLKVMDAFGLSIGWMFGGNRDDN